MIKGLVKRSRLILITEECLREEVNIKKWFPDLSFDNLYKI